MANVRGGVNRLHNPVVEEIVPSYDWSEDSKGHYLLVDLPGFKKNQVKIQIFSSGVIKVNGERPVNENKYVRFEQNFEVPKNSNSDGITAKFDGEILYITVPKHVVEEKKEPEPEPQPQPVSKPEPEPEPAGIKDQSVNGTTKENTHKKPNDEEAKKKDEQGLGNGQVHERKKKEEIQRNAPMRFSADTVRRWEGETSYLESMMEILSKNKAIVVTAMLAFSLGMLISRKFEANGE
ncbi:hypothetical protein TIFTF001_014882 [Ficus carica]|uniref:SHSP domain-containing protein n=1 Tax=Ficus carica TaxID=3494 RepID=A0AA88A4N1_FICCA|nr:hypothetical protein TIFTF001_014882 [Ficus carica]